MQTIARVNRVYKEKTNGLIVDYIWVFHNLQKALSIYATNWRMKSNLRYYSRKIRTLVIKSKTRTS